ncbi:MAG: ABC transporter substrate-binding protein [Betaproteobacteria bacterium]
MGLNARQRTETVPHVDFREATPLAMGKSWHSATPAPQARMISEFRSMLVRIYSNAIDTHRGQIMLLMPVRMAAGVEGLIRRLVEKNA